MRYISRFTHLFKTVLTFKISHDISFGFPLRIHKILYTSKSQISFAPDFSDEWCKQKSSNHSSNHSSAKRTTVLTTMSTKDTQHNGVENGYITKTPFLIGVAGGTASGKSTVCKRIMEKLGQDDIDHSQRRVVCISQDAFYRPLSPEETAKALKGAFNFDHPDAFDNELIVYTLQQILDGKICDIPNYDYVTNSRLETKTTIYQADVVLFEGILMFYQPEIRALFHLKLFVDSDADTRLARRVMRDTSERGRQLEHVLTQYTKLVKPAFEEFCLPTKKFADVIIPRGAENTVAINLIVQHIQEIVNHKKECRGKPSLPPDSDAHIR